MKVTIDLENLESLVQNTMETNIENIVKEQIIMAQLSRQKFNIFIMN